MIPTLTGLLAPRRVRDGIVKTRIIRPLPGT